MGKFNFHRNKMPSACSSVVVFPKQGLLSTPSKKAEKKLSTVCVQIATVIDFAVGEEKACVQAEWREHDMLALRVIASQAIISAVVFFRYLVSNVMTVADFYDLQREKKNSTSSIE